MDPPARAWPEALKRWWLGSALLSLVAALLAVSTVFLVVAHWIYKPAEPESFPSLIATDVLINGVVVVALGAVLGLAASVGAAIRDRAEAEAQRRLELFLRIRGAHVRAAQSRQVLCARRDVDTYHDELRTLLSVTQELGEIREEVRVSGALYGDTDREWIGRGIAIMIAYLEQGLAEYTAWCQHSIDEASGRPEGSGSWVAGFVADYDAFHEKHVPDDPRWEPSGRTPFRYDDGLEQSKLIMRAYVYGSSGHELQALRQQVMENIAWRRRARAAGGTDAADIPPEA